jgi:trigger factor
MKASFQPISEIEVRIDVELPADRVDRELAKQLANFSRRARVKGFRPGKAPRDVVKKSLGGDIAAEATRSLINDAFAEALESVGKDRVVGQPSVEPTLAREGQPLKFAIKAEVKPQVEVHSWKNIEVGVAPATVTAEAVNGRIAALQAKHKERVPVEDRGADTRDVCLVSFKGWLNGQRDTRLDGNEIEVTIGSGSMIPGWEDELIGLKAGETKRFDITFPEEYRAADLSGQQATFEVTLNTLFAEEVPELDDDFAKDAGYESFEDLREKTAEAIAKELNERRDQEIEKKVITVLLERNVFAVPPSMVEAYAQERARNLLQFWRMQGLPETRAMQFLEQNWQGIMNQAHVEVRRHLALEALARQERVEVSDDELSEAIVERIKEHGERAAKVYERPDMREALMSDITAKKTVALLIANASVVDAAPEQPANEG